MMPLISFKSEKSFAFVVFTWLSIILVSINPAIMFYNKTFGLWSLLPLLVIPFILWPWFNTKYVIQDDIILYRSAFLKGRIVINNIQKIEKNKTLWSGVKPALGTKGLIIHYLDGIVGEEIYFSPIDKERFIAELLRINPEIEVVDKAVV